MEHEAVFPDRADAEEDDFPDEFQSCVEHEAVFPDRADAEEDDFPDEFQCCVCLEIMYKPVVLACGHISCFWCTFKAMDAFLQSHCPVCRNPYNHFPRSCELLHFLIMKLYPSAYKRRAAQVAEEERRNRLESPQFESNFVVSESSEAGCAQDAMSKLHELSIQDSSDIISHEHNGIIQSVSSSKTASNDTNTVETSTTKVLVSDLECGVCKQLLYRPIVLNCGHVYCESCIHPDESVYKCPTCRSAHPKGIPNLCLFLHHFLEEYFPKEYKARKESLAHCLSEGPSESPTEKNEQDKKSPPGPLGYMANSHPGVGCDYCGMYPIIGLRYKCKDCLEAVGFDLCENCYKSSSKLPGRFNQQHTEKHEFEVIQAPRLRMVLSSFVVSEDDEAGPENDRGG